MLGNSVTFIAAQPTPVDDIEARAETDEEDELEDEWGEADLRDQNDGPIQAQTLPTSTSSTGTYAHPREYRQEFEGVISRYGSDTRSRDDGEAGASSRSQLSATPGNDIDKLRSVMGPVLMRNPNPDIVAVIGMEEEVRAAKTQAEKDFQWAKEEGILVQGATAEDFLRPPTKRLRNQSSTFERAARRQTTLITRGWEKWAAKRNQPAPEENWSPSRPLAPGEWVKVTVGTYAGDEGMVFDENGTSATSPSDVEYAIFLVPRLAPAHMDGVRTNDKKRKRTTERWPPRPFDPKEYVTAQLGDKGKSKASGEDALYTYNKMTFSNGLLIKSYRGTRLIPLEYVAQPFTGRYQHPLKYASRPLMELFQRHSFCRNFPLPLPDYWRFEPGDEVFVEDEYIISPRREKGIVQECTENNFLINFGRLEDGSDDVRPVSERRLRKVVSPGDYVRILSGPFEGREGSVVEKHGPLLAVLEKNDTSSKRFLVNRNCVRREKASFYRPPAVPWLDKEVTIELGQHAGRHGIVKDVALGPYGDCFLLSLFIPELECSAKIEDTNVFLKGTRMHLWEFYPPENAAWIIDSRVRGIRSGPTPWKRVQVAVVGGNHKGLTGIVRDVFRTQKPAAASGLELDVELDVIRAGSGVRYERIYYDH
ncbi:transcription elongation factor spt5, partial [Marasmius sp. AFHP31]